MFRRRGLEGTSTTYQPTQPLRSSQFVNGMREGVGTLKDSSGRKTYAGQWKMGENHGEGSSWEYEGSTMDSKSWYSGGEKK